MFHRIDKTAWVVLAGLWLQTTTADSADLNQVVLKALANHPDVLEIANARKARAEAVEQAEAGYRPSIDLNAGIGYEYTNSPATRAAAGSGTAELTRTETGISARQMLFDGFATDSEVSRQQEHLRSADHRLLGTAEATALKVVQAYLDVQRFEEIERQSQRNLEAHLRVLDQIRLRSDAGVGRRADLDQIKARAALAEASLVAAQVNTQDARTTYQRVVGELPPEQLAEPQRVTILMPNSLEDALTQALAHHPILHSANADVAAAQAQNRAAKHALYPRVDLELQSNLNSDVDGVSSYNNDLSAMVRMRYNLYNGGADKARIRETLHQIGEASEIRNRSRRQVEETLRLAWSAYRATARQQVLVEQQLRFSISTRDAYSKQFNIGQRTLLDLLNTENEVFQARQSLVDTRTDMIFAEYRVLEAQGRLLNGLGINPTSVASLKP